LGFFFDTRIGICAAVISHPSDFSFGGDEFAKHKELVATPIQGLREHLK
jgi:hypothetical protein